MTKYVSFKNRALRLIYSANRQDHAIPLFLNAKVLPLNLNTPINILNLISRTSNSHHYSTRSSTSQNFYIKKLDLVYKRMRSIMLAQRYGMSNSFKNISKKKLKGKLLNILKTKDNYIDNDKIMARLKKFSYNSSLSI